MTFASLNAAALDTCCQENSRRNAFDHRELCPRNYKVQVIPRDRVRGRSVEKCLRRKLPRDLKKKGACNHSRGSRLIANEKKLGGERLRALRLHVEDRGTADRGGEKRPYGTSRTALWKQAIMQAEECRVLHRWNDRIHASLPLCIINLSAIRYIDPLPPRGQRAFFEPAERDAKWILYGRCSIPRGMSHNLLRSLCEKFMRSIKIRAIDSGGFLSDALAHPKKFILKCELG